MDRRTRSRSTKTPEQWASARRGMVWTAAIVLSLIVTTLVRLPSIRRDLGRYDEIDAEKRQRSAACIPYLSFLDKQSGTLRASASSLTPLEKNRLQITGRPLIIDRSTRQISELHDPLNTWSKPLQKDEPLTLLVIDNRSSVVYPEWFTRTREKSGVTDKVAGQGEKADLYVMRYPEGELVGHFELTESPPAMLLPTWQADRPGVEPELPRGRVESAFENWYSKATDESWDESCKRRQMRNPRRDIITEPLPQKSTIHSLLSVTESPPEIFYAVPKDKSYVVSLHASKFFSAWLVICVPIFGLAAIVVWTMKSSR